MNQNKTVFCQLTAYSPIHVGNGSSYKRDLDYIIDNNRLILYDTNRALRAIEEKGDLGLIQSLTPLFGHQQFSVKELLQKAGLPEENYRKVSMHFMSHAREIKTITRDAFGKPFLPGSSLKGSFRTALAAHYLMNLDDATVKHLMPKKKGGNKVGVKKERAFEKLGKFVLGEDPNHDLLRYLQVSDCYFREEDVRIVDSKILNRTKDGFGFLKVGREKQNFPLPLYYRGTSNMVESVFKNASSRYFTITFDEFLQKEHQKIFKQAPPDAAEFFQILKEHFRRLAASELAFYRDIQFQAGIQFYQELIDRQYDDNKIPVRLGWGSGWEFMTGKYLSDENLAYLRSIIQLGNNHMPFPKSRKIAVVDGEPSMPLGWAILTLLSKEEVETRRRETRIQQQREMEEARRREEERLKKQAEQERLQALQKAEEEKKRQEKEKWEQLSEEEKIEIRISRLTSDPNEVAQVVRDCLQGNFEPALYRKLKEKLMQLGQWKPAGSKQRKQKMRKRNEQIDGKINA